MIDGDNIGTELSHFLLGFCEIGSEAGFQVLATGMGHDDVGTEKGAGGVKIIVEK